MGKEQTNRDVLARIKLKVENPLKSLSEGHQKDFLQDVSSVVLKEICKTRGIKGYSGKNKSSLSDLIVANLPKTEFEELLNTLSETEKKIKNYKNHWQKQFKRESNTVTRSDEILQSEPYNISALKDKSYALNLLGEVEEVFRIYDVILSIDSNNGYIMGEKADLLAEQGRFEEAVYWYEKALEIPGWYGGIQGDYIAKKGKLLITMNRIDEAIKLIKNALDDYRTGITHLEFINEDGWEDLRDLYETLIGLQYKYEDEEAILISYTNWGNHLKALYNFCPPDVFLEKAKLLEKKEDYEEAQKALDIIIKEVQGEVKFDIPFHNSEYFLDRCKYWQEALFHKARIYALQDDKANAMKNLKRAVIIALNSDKWVEEHLYRTSPYFLDEMKEVIRRSPEFDGYRDDLENSFYHSI